MRLGLVFACILIAVAVPGGVLAERIAGTDHSDRLVGTKGADTIDGKGGNDTISGLAGNDVLIGGLGRDRIIAGSGNDFVGVNGDEAQDTVSCGTGRDVVNADPGDTISRDCEVTSLQISNDAVLGHGGRHETEVEPDSFSYGQTIVAIYQVGRFEAGGADAIGAATSVDGGTHWRQTLLPGLTSSSPQPNTDPAVTDPTIAYDATHRVWLAATLGGKRGAVAIRVSRSPNGLSWSLPVAARQSPETLDKDWIACDNWPNSPNVGHCYLSYLDRAAEGIVTQTSTDGGRTWTPAVMSSIREPEGSDASGAQPLPRPDGELVVVYTVIRNGPKPGGDVFAASSIDGGASFQTSVHIASLAFTSISGVRAPPFPSADVASDGRLFVAWEDCGAVPGCSRDRIVLSTSSDGAAWSSPTPIGPALAGQDEFVPGLAADPTTAGRAQRLALAYYSIPSGCAAHSGCPGIDVWLVTSSNGGASWSSPQRLDADSMPLSWIAMSGERFVGDYISTSYVGGRPIPVYSLAVAPWGGKLRQATMALRP